MPTYDVIAHVNGKSWVVVNEDTQSSGNSRASGYAEGGVWKKDPNSSNRTYYPAHKIDAISVQEVPD